MTSAPAPTESALALVTAYRAGDLEEVRRIVYDVHGGYEVAEVVCGVLGLVDALADALEAMSGHVAMLHKAIELAAPDLLEGTDAAAFSPLSFDALLSAAALQLAAVQSSPRPDVSGS